MWFWIALSVSVLLNIFFIWYLREFLIRFAFLTENSSGIYEIIEDFEKHLEEVYGLETYYGDETLSGLLRHTGDLKEDMGQFKEIFKIGLTYWLRSL